jgi:hypothetical protein
MQAGEPFDPGQAARLSHDCRAWLNSALRALDRLGMSPTSRANSSLLLIVLPAFWWS